LADTNAQKEKINLLAAVRYDVAKLRSEGQIAEAEAEQQQA